MPLAFINSWSLAVSPMSLMATKSNDSKVPIIDTDTVTLEEE